jgi:hypothetical protein
MASSAIAAFILKVSTNVMAVIAILDGTVHLFS